MKGTWNASVKIEEGRQAHHESEQGATTRQAVESSRSERKAARARSKKSALATIQPRLQARCSHVDALAGPDTGDIQDL